MEIQKLHLTDFRNYASLDFEPAQGLNILYGRNAQGKSAILEAVYLIATSKSHRTSHDADLIRTGCESARVAVSVARTTQNDVTLEVVLSRSEKKSIKINTVRHDRIGDIVGQLNAVIFSTADIDMIRGEPSLRRRFLDLEISQIKPQYVYALGRYKRVLQQRNNLLKDIKSGANKASELEIWDKQLASYGASVIAKRMEFVASLSEAAARIYYELADHAEELSISYKSNPPAEEVTGEDAIAQHLARVLAGRRELDLARGVTTAGPHRDDLLVNIAAMPARDFASQGQQRTAAVALKLAEIDIMERNAGETPVVLLDDVAAELDEVRRARVMEHVVGRCQALVTTTDLSELGQEASRAAGIFEVESGKVIEK